MIDDMFSLDEALPGRDLAWLVHPTEPGHLSRNADSFADRLKTAPSQPLDHQLMIVAFGDLVIRAPPFVLGAPRFADAFQPGVQRLVMVFDRVVLATNESETIVVADLVD